MKLGSCTRAETYRVRRTRRPRSLLISRTREKKTALNKLSERHISLLNLGWQRRDIGANASGRAWITEWRQWYITMHTMYKYAVHIRRPCACESSVTHCYPVMKNCLFYTCMYKILTEAELQLCIGYDDLCMSTVGSVFVLGAALDLPEKYTWDCQTFCFSA